MKMRKTTRSEKISRPGIYEVPEIDMNDHIKDMIEMIGTDTSGKWMTTDNARLLAETVAMQCALIAGLMEHEDRTNIGAAILDKFGIEDE